MVGLKFDFERGRGEVEGQAGSRGGRAPDDAKASAPGFDLEHPSGSMALAPGVRSMSEPLRVLIVDDSATDAKLVVRELRRSGVGVSHERIDTAEAMRRALRESDWDVIVCDWSMPRFSARAALAVVKELEIDLPFIIVSGTTGEENAVEAMRAGAHDYVLKDRLSRLVPAVEREMREYRRRLAHAGSEYRLQEALRQSEGQLRQAQKMEAVGRLAGGVAHDFNNALSVILAYGEMLLAAVPADDPNREDIEEIRRAGERAADLTRQLLMFSRQNLVEPKVIDANEVLAKMEKMLSRVLGEDVEVSMDKAPLLWRTLVDPSSFDHLVMNLVVNARDAMPRGGKLAIRTRNAKLTEALMGTQFRIPEGEYVCVTVADTGTGMDSATLARIFEPFFTTKERGKGTGLGLSTVFGIIQHSGGAIDVRSRPGEGTTFDIYLPRIDAPATTDDRSVEPLLRVGSETILLVEDEEPVRTMVKTVLERRGYHVIAAGDGKSAINASEQYHGPIHMLLTDVIMPRMSGPDLARELVQSRPEMRVLFVSGYTDDSVLRHGIEEGDVHFLQKPITPATLTRRLRELLDAPPNPASAIFPSAGAR
jgi:signal transduction histidine kinase